MTSTVTFYEMYSKQNMTWHWPGEDKPLQNKRIVIVGDVIRQALSISSEGSFVDGDQLAVSTATEVTVGEDAGSVTTRGCNGESSKGEVHLAPACGKVSLATCAERRGPKQLTY